MPFTITSTSFRHNGAIPARHACDGQNVSPPLNWNGVPASAKSLVLIVDDPDAPDPKAPKRTWVHWVLYNIPAHAHGLAEGIAAAAYAAGKERLAADRLRRSLPADRESPLLPQTVCARYGAAGPEVAHQGCLGSRDAGPYHQQYRTDRSLPAAALTRMHDE